MKKRLWWRWWRRDYDEDDEDKQIEKIYKFIINTANNKRLSNDKLKNISEIYWKKTNDYSKAIKLFESDVITKQFVKLYKGINVKK